MSNFLQSQNRLKDILLAFDSGQLNLVSLAIIILTLCSLTILYIYLFVKGLRSFIKIATHRSSTRMGKTFYLLIFLISVARIVAFSLLVWQSVVKYEQGSNDDNQTIENLILGLRYLPDVLFLWALALFSWLVVTIFLIGLIQLDDYKIITLDKKNIYFVIWVILTLIFGLAEVAAFLVFYLANTLSDNQYVLTTSIINMSCIVFIIICELVLHCKFSGVPWKSEFHHRRFIKVNRLLLFWGIGRVIEASMGVLATYLKIQLWDFLLDNDIDSLIHLLNPILFIAQLFFAEILPIMVVLDNDTMSMFLIRRELRQEIESNADQQPERSRISSLHENLLKEQASPIDKRASQESWNDVNSNESLTFTRPLITKQEEIKFEDKEISTSEEKLGKIRFALGEKGEKLVVRTVKLNRITPYLIEEVKKEVTRLGYMNIDFLLATRKIVYPFLIKVRGYYMSGSEVNIITERAENGSLYQLLHAHQKDRNQLNMKLKLKIAQQIATAMHYLHSQGSPIIHGHLNSHNVMLNDDFRPKITDFGFGNLKKYANLVGGYYNQSAYTAPEIFSDKGKYIIPEEPSADVYSFGMILWELVTEKAPFEGLGRAELHKMICQENSRPKIPETVPEAYANIIRACWQQDAAKRPKFHDLKDLIEELLDE